MAGLLDFLNTPAGQGLLSGVASYAMNARQGTPVNNVGRGLAGGLMGYTQANEQTRKDEENAIARQYKQMQVNEMQRKIAEQEQTQKWRAGLPAALSATKEQAAPFQADNAFGEDLGNLQSVTQVPDMQARQEYLMAPGSPVADKMLERQFMPSQEKPQLVTTYENGSPVQKWVRPGETEGVVLGAGKPEEIKPMPREDVHIGGGMWRTMEFNPETRQFDKPIGEAFTKKPGASEVTVNGFPKETFKNERDLRNDFQGLPTTKAFREVQTSYDQIKYALDNPSAANDLTAATKFMKLLDPGSVVRESELGMAMAATGQIDRMSNYYNMLKTGQKLTPSQRADFAKSAAGLYAAATRRYNQSADEYRAMAQEYGLNPDRVSKPAASEQPNQNKRAASFDLPPNAKQYEGKILRDSKTNKRFKSVNGKWQEVK